MAGNTASRTRSNSGSPRDWIRALLQRLVVLLQVLVWPLETLWNALWPAVPCVATTGTEGLAAASGAKAAQQFVAHLQKLYQEQHPVAVAIPEPSQAQETTGLHRRHAAPTAVATTDEANHADRVTAHPNTTLDDNLWCQSGFAAAQQEAVDRSALLFVYLHAPLHASADTFCRTVLCSPDMVAWLGQVVALGVSIQSGVGAHLAHVLQAKAFPFCALLQPQPGNNNNRPSQVMWVLRAEGPALLQLSRPRVNARQTTSLWMSYLQAAVTRHETEMAGQLARRLQQEEDVMLRRLQDEEFERGLAEDQQREQAQQEARQREQEAEQAVEAAQLAETQAKESLLDQARALILPEPTEQAVQIRFVLPSGAKLNRKFAPEQTLRALQAYVRIHDSEHAKSDDETMGTIGLSTSYPRRTFVVQQDEEKECELDKTLAELGLGPQAVLMVQDLDA